MSASAKEQYADFIASIDASIAGRDEHGDLRWHIECSAEANAGDMQAEGVAERTEEGWYSAALDTAKMCLDDWKSYYPQLRLPAPDPLGGRRTS